ncbi:DNA-binding FadR family transcriptional regulator [Pseudonocardia hierapolitana]|uniref:DNA-binding FadR family transcriptional regulator n=1 Tax=Pseudonocardia hierapolitana TaxID=1128676 RepID=A0A561SZB4_9PSEU|nr:FCD domain-containing protein [Pseudonocardia hierapolitana]TWF80209.1 DNA-binding FadR family transcriptional regulator [Pseudonocardia hierapolitana]
MTDERAYRPGYQIAAERILEHIRAAGLSPGDRLPTEKQLAAELGVSHTVAREAVKLLCARGHLTVRKRAGIFVARPDDRLPPEIWGSLLVENLEHVEMLFECRRTIEGQTAALASQRATPVQVRALREFAERTVAAAESDDQAAFIEADEEFHRALAEAAHNTFLASIVETISALKLRVLTVGLGTEPGTGMRRGAAEHQAIAAAVADGATEAAESAMHVHVDRALAGYRAEVQRNLFAATTPAPPG